MTIFTIAYFIPDVERLTDGISYICLIRIEPKAEVLIPIFRESYPLNPMTDMCSKFKNLIIYIISF